MHLGPLQAWRNYEKLVNKVLMNSRCNGCRTRIFYIVNVLEGIGFKSVFRFKIIHLVVRS